MGRTALLGVPHHLPGPAHPAASLASHCTPRRPQPPLGSHSPPRFPLVPQPSCGSTAPLCPPLILQHLWNPTVFQGYCSSHSIPRILLIPQRLWEPTAFLGSHSILRWLLPPCVFILPRPPHESILSVARAPSTLRYLLNRLFRKNTPSLDYRLDSHGRTWLREMQSIRNTCKTAGIPKEET